MLHAIRMTTSLRDAFVRSRALLALLPLFFFSSFFPSLAFITACSFFAILFLTSLSLSGFFGRLPGRFFFGLLTTLAIVAILLTPVYYVFFWHPALAAWTVCCIAVLSTLLPSNGSDSEQNEHYPRADRRDAIFIGLIAGIDLFLLATALFARSGLALMSPWSFYLPLHFLAFGIATFLLFVQAERLRTSLLFPLASLHLFAAYSVVAFVVAHGFGYDPFIHRASVQHILSEGVLLPKQPYYIGEYVLFATIARFSHIPLLLLDVWFLPILTSLLVPPVLYAGLRRGMHLSHANAAPWLLAPLLLPLPALTFTIPYNISFLLWLLLVFLAPLAVSFKPIRIFCFLLILFSWTLHPLLSVSATLYLVSCLLFPKLRTLPRRTVFFFGFFALQAIGIPALLLLREWNPSLPFAIANPMHRIDYFYGLFTDPFSQAFWASWPWQALYQYYLLLPLIAALLGVIGFFFQSRVRGVFSLVFFSGTLLTLFLMSTVSVVQSLAPYEQSEFALRLKQAALLFFLPGIISFGLVFREQFPRVGRYALPIFFAIFSVASWHATYPQMNPKAFQAGWNASDGDIHVVEELERRSPDEPYVVLSSQMTSVVALERLGFRKTAPNGDFVYPLSSTGRFYHYYLRIYSPETTDYRALAGEAMEYAGVERLFMLIPDYSWGAQSFAAKITPHADSYFTIDGGAIHVFSFDRAGNRKLSTQGSSQKE